MEEGEEEGEEEKEAEEEEKEFIHFFFLDNIYFPVSISDIVSVSDCNFCRLS